MGRNFVAEYQVGDGTFVRAYKSPQNAARRAVQLMMLSNNITTCTVVNQELKLQVASVSRVGKGSLLVSWSRDAKILGWAD